MLRLLLHATGGYGGVAWGSRVAGMRMGQAPAPPPNRSLTFSALRSPPRRKDIHPEWHPEAKVICNGVEVMTVGGVKPSYNVDIYSGNHPFYQGAGATMVMDEGQVRSDACGPGGPAGGVEVGMPPHE